MKTRIVTALAAAALVGALTPRARVHVVAAPPPLTVVAAGLNNPRGLAIASDGTVYVAEAGAGGVGPCVKGENGPTCFGLSGSVVRIRNGRWQRIQRGLPSVAAAGGMSASGPSDITVAPDGSLNVTMQGVDMQTPHTFGPSGGALQHLMHVNPDGTRRAVADLYAYEKAANPDSREINSDPYALVTQSAGEVVADAAANDVLSVDGMGRVSTLAVFPTRLVMGPGGKMIPMESVPDSIAMGADGAYYVGELTGFPFPVGGARIYRVAPGQRPTIWASGFTNIISLAFGPDHSLYVVEIFKNGLSNVNPKDPATLAGALIRITPDGTRTTVASGGLVAPTGVAVSRMGAVYVSNFGILSGRGQVVRITP